MTGCIKTTHRRGPNSLNANPQRIESEDGTRWATGRTVKGETAVPHVYVPVDVWTCKARNEQGKVVVVKTHVGRDEALAFVGEAK
jgi:hypothetical protein